MDSYDDSNSGSSASKNAFQKKVQFFHTVYQTYLDRTTPHKGYRWLAWSIIFVLFFVRVVYAQGFYVVCYAYSIFVLNQFLLFLTPKIDMSLQQDESNKNLESGAGEEGDEGDDNEDDSRRGGSQQYNGGGGGKSDAEFRPFIRRLPEFKFWYKSFVGLLICMFMTFFNIFDLPVFWPILVMYFALLFFLTMRRQIQHMIKYRYIPLDVGKKKYGKSSSSSSQSTVTMNV